LWAGILICGVTSFYVDRYVVYTVFPLLLLVRRCLGGQIRLWLAAALGFCYLASVRLFGAVVMGDNLQVEFMDGVALRRVAAWGACAVLLVLLDLCAKLSPWGKSWNSSPNEAG